MDPTRWGGDGAVEGLNSRLIARDGRDRKGWPAAASSGGAGVRRGRTGVELLILVDPKISLDPSVMSFSWTHIEPDRG